MDEQQPLRVVVEVATPETVKRLEDENARLREQLKLLQGRLDKLHETVYHLIDRLGELKRSLKDK